MEFQVTKASEIPGAIAKAYYIARTGRPGPVVIDISKNAQVEEFDYSYKPCIYLRSYKPHPEVDPKAIQRAVEMINAAERPLLIVGQGVKTRRRGDQVAGVRRSGRNPDGADANGYFDRAEQPSAVHRYARDARQYRR